MYRFMRESQFTPKLFSILRKGITKEQLQKDLIAGLIVGIVALPLAFVEKTMEIGALERFGQIQSMYEKLISTQC